MDFSPAVLSVNVCGDSLKLPANPQDVGKLSYPLSAEGRQDGRHHFTDPIHEVAQRAEQAETTNTNRVAHVGSQRRRQTWPY